MADHEYANPLFYQAKTHIGVGLDASPADVALATLRQAARDVAACLEEDPSIRLTLPVPVAVWDLLDEIRKGESHG